MLTSARLLANVSLTIQSSATSLHTWFDKSKRLMHGWKSLLTKRNTCHWICSRSDWAVTLLVSILASIQHYHICLALKPLNARSMQGSGNTNIWILCTWSRSNLWRSCIHKGSVPETCSSCMHWILTLFCSILVGGQGEKIERLYREVRAYAIPGT